MTPSPLLSHYCTYIYTTPAIYLPSPSRSCSCSSGNLLACFPPLFLRCPLAAALYCLPACLTYSTQLNYITHKLLTYLLTPILSTFTHPPQKSLTMSMASPPPLLLPALLPATHCCLRVIYCHLRFAQVLPFYPMSHFLPQAAKLVVSTLQYQHLCFLHIYAAHKLLKHRKILNSKCSFTLHTINDVVVFPQYMRHLWY